MNYCHKCGSLEIKGYCSNKKCETQYKCPYCNSNVVLKDSSVVYGKSYGFVYICDNFPNCYSYVGVHKGTKKALGRLANNELRKLKMEAHKYFDHIWHLKSKRGFLNARSNGYKWLSRVLGIPIEYTHIGYFDKELTLKVIELCKPYYHIKK